MAAHRTRRPPAALLLESFPIPPSHIPASPSANPPPTGPPSTPLPPVPGPSRLSGAEHHQLLSSLASRAHRPPSTASHGHPASPTSPASASTPRLSTSSLLAQTQGPHSSPPRGPRTRGPHAPSPSSYTLLQPQLRDLAFSPAPLSDVDDDDHPPFPANPRRPSHQANESLSEIDVADILRATANDDGEGETGLLPPFELSLSRSQNGSQNRPSGSLRRSTNDLLQRGNGSGRTSQVESLKSSNDSLRTSQDGSYFASDSAVDQSQARRVALSTSATTFAATSMPTATATAHRANSNVATNLNTTPGSHQPIYQPTSYLENHHQALNSVHHPSTHHAQNPPPQKPAPAADHPLPPLPPTLTSRPPAVPRIQTDLNQKTHMRTGSAGSFSYPTSSPLCPVHARALVLRGGDETVGGASLTTSVTATASAPLSTTASGKATASLVAVSSSASGSSSDIALPASTRPPRAKPPPLGGVRGPSASSLYAPSAMARTYSSVSAASSVGSFHTAPSTPYLEGTDEGMAGVGTWDRSRMGAVGMLGLYQHQHASAGTSALEKTQVPGALASQYERDSALPQHASASSSAGPSVLEKAPETDKMPGALAAQYERDSALPYLRPSESTSTQWSGASDTSLLEVDVRGMVAAAGDWPLPDAPKPSQDSSPPLSPPPSAGLGLSGRFHTRMSSMGLGLHSRTVSSGEALADEDDEASFATFMGTTRLNGAGTGSGAGRPAIIGGVGAAGTLAGRRRNGLTRKDSTVLGRMDDLIRGRGEGETLHELDETTRTSSDTKQMPSSDTPMPPSSSSATPHTPPSSSPDSMEPKSDTPPISSDSKMERRPSVKDLRRELRAARVRSPGLREAFMGSAAAAGKREGSEASGSGNGSGSGSPALSLMMSTSPSLGLQSDAGSSNTTASAHDKVTSDHDATKTKDTPTSAYDDTSDGLLRVEMDDDTRSLVSFETTTSVSEEREPYLPRADPAREALLRGIVVLTTTSVEVEEGTGSSEEMTLDELGVARDAPVETERMPNGPTPTASTSTMGASGSTASTSGHPDFGAGSAQHPKTPMRSTATVSRASVEEVARLRALTEQRQREKEERARAASPDIVTILRTTPRPALVKGRVRARSASRTRTRSRGAVSSAGPGRMSASVGAGRRGGVAEDGAEWDEWGALKRSDSGAAASLGAGTRERPEEEGESDSSIDLHTPLPNLMVRHGLLSPYSKLLPGAASRAVTPAAAAEPGGRPGSMMSVASNGSRMTKSGLIKDERDTHTRRVRHRDGRLLAGGIGLTTGLGWSDSEDEDAPSPLTRRISSLNLSRRSSASSVLHHSTSATYSAGRRTHPLSRSYSASALALGLPRHPEERERVLDEYDDEYEDGPEDLALQNSGEWAQRQRRAAGTAAPPTSWAARSVGSGSGVRSSVAAGSATTSLRSSVGGDPRTSTSSIGSTFSLEVTPARTPSRMRKPSGGRMSMEKQYQRTSQSTSQTPVARRASRDELNTPSSTASTLSLPMPSTPRDEFDSASVSTTTTTANGTLFGLGVGQAKSRGSLDKDKSLPPLPPGGIKRMTSTPRFGSNELSTTSGAPGTSTSRIGVPRSRTISTMSSGRASNSATTPLPPSAAFGSASTAQRTPPSPAVRPLQLPRVRAAAAAAAAGGDRAAVPVPSVSGYGLPSSTSASSLASPPLTTRGSLRSPTSSFSSSATSPRAVSPGPPSTGATPRPKPRTGTGMVYRTSSGSGLGARGRVGVVGPAAGSTSAAQRSATGSLGRAGGRAAVF